MQKYECGNQRSTKIKSLRCKLGFHDREYLAGGDARVCLRCDKVEVWNGYADLFSWVSLAERRDRLRVQDQRRAIAEKLYEAEINRYSV